MSVIRHYVMTVKPEAAEGFPAAIRKLKGALDSLPGLRGVALAQDADQPLRFVFQETWDSIEAHKAAGGSLPKAEVAPLMAALAEPMQGSYLTVLPL